MRNVFGLEFKVFSVLAGLALVAATTIGFMIFALNESRTNQHIASQLAQLETISNSIFRRSEHYQRYAPRSFPAYNRDLVVFYPDFANDLKSMDDLMIGIGEDYYQRAPAVMIGNIGVGLRTNQVDASFQAMTNAWQTFYSELRLELGDNDAEPRLEWGTKYIRENQEQLRKVVGTSIEMLNHELVIQTERMQKTSYVAMGLLLVMALAGLLWFYIGVTTRLKRAVAGCVRVSSGDFGYQMRDDASHDEIGTLGRAINNLSMRTRLVLSMVDNIRTAKNHSAALHAIWEESKPLFDLVWLGLYRLDNDLDYMELLNAQPQVWSKILKHQDIRAQPSPRQVIQTQESMVIDDMEAFTNTRPTERLIRSLTLKVVNSRSSLLLPLIENGQTWGLLVLISENKNAFGKEDVKLLSNLTPLLSDAFAKVESIAQEKKEVEQAAAEFDESVQQAQASNG